MKISVGMLVVNGRPFIEAQLKNLYDIAHEIVICEGGDKFWHARHGYWRSTDGTIDIIKNFPDPDKKIKLIQKNWKNKNEMSHTFSEGMTGDIIYSVDLDEFMNPTELVAVCKKLMTQPFTSVTIPHYVFYGDFETLMAMEHSPTWVQVPRIFKRQKNSLIHHLPMAYWNMTTKTPYNPKKMPHKMVPDVFIYHYSWVYRKSVRDKIAYYAHRIPGCIRKDWLDKYFEDFASKKDALLKSKENIRPTEGAKQFLLPFKGKHPEIVSEIQKDIALLDAVK
tara:strand:- start:59711 stop:60547 length:837 start_codon:yes stop_codon:yes gene_type:complete